ncbi:MAG: response regulator [Clostridia bacterium]|nr:response regulator [Clostridia bacterium]
MYKLLIVDDERIVIDAVKFIINKEVDDILVAGTASTGREAIKAAAEIKPDIILMDIRMPGINGIEAIKEIKKIYSDVQFVIMSAYEQFEFAKQSVELGVIDYLMKPVNKGRLVETLKKITEKLDMEKRLEEIQLDNMEKYKKALTVLEQGFIYSILFNKEYGTDLGKYKEILNLNMDTGYMAILHMTDKRTEKHISTGLKSHKIYSEFKNILKYKTKCVVGPILVDRIIVYIQSANEDEYSGRLDSIRMGEEIIERISEKEPEVRLQMSIGSIRKDDEIVYSYEEAVKAMRAVGDGKVIHISDVSGKIINYDSDLRVEEGNLLNLIESGETSSLNNALHRLFEKCEKAEIARTGNFINHRLRGKLIEIMVIAHRIADEAGIAGDSYLNFDNYLGDLIEIGNYNDFKTFFIQKVVYIANKINEHRDNTTNELMSRANNIIKTQFREDISLDSLSRTLGISPQYFSRLYKNETGRNFIEYLTDARMTQARKLIREGKYSIKEICFMVGYSDPNYFSRLFKKIEGRSPTEYAREFEK